MKRDRETEGKISRLFERVRKNMANIGVKASSEYRLYEIRDVEWHDCVTFDVKFDFRTAEKLLAYMPESLVRELYRAITSIEFDVIRNIAAAKNDEACEINVGVANEMAVKLERHIVKCQTSENNEEYYRYYLAKAKESFSIADWEIFGKKIKENPRKMSCNLAVEYREGFYNIYERMETSDRGSLFGPNELSAKDALAWLEKNIRIARQTQAGQMKLF